MSRELLTRLWRSWTLRIIATILLVGLVVWFSHPERLLTSASKLGVINVVLAAILTVPFIYFKSLRWMYMLRYAGSDATFSEAATSLVGGMGLALVTPARVGELSRVAYLRDTRKLRLSALVMLDKFFDVLVLVLLAIVGAWVIFGIWAGLGFLALGLAGLAFTFFPKSFGGPISFIERKVPLGGKTKEIFSSLESLSLAASALYVLLTLAAFVLVIIQFGIILRGSTHVNPGVAILTFPMIILTNVLPVTIAGLGIREGAAVLLLRPFHVSAATAAVSAFIMFFLNTAIPGIIGALIPLFRQTKAVAKPSESPASTGDGGA